ADDFGQTPGVNQGIIEAHQHGIVTSASLMVRSMAAAEAAAYGREHPDFSLGLHLDLGEWIYRDETWAPLYEVVPLHDSCALEDELTRQLNAFRKLVGRAPSHIDSHQHVHREEPLRSLAVKVAKALAVPLRDCDAAVRYCGSFYGQNAKGFSFPEAISVAGLMDILSGLPPGLTELGCHPGDGEDVDSMYRSERLEEVKTLCDLRIRTAILSQGIQLCSFASSHLQ